MPEDGWYSLTVRISTAKAVREVAKSKGLTIDEFLNKLHIPEQGAANLQLVWSEG